MFPLSAKQFLSKEISFVFQTSNSAMARSVAPILKLRPSLERGFYALSYESNLSEATWEHPKVKKWLIEGWPPR